MLHICSDEESLENCQDQTGLIGSAILEEAEALHVAPLSLKSPLFENTEGQIRRYNPVGSIHNFADL
jgi:hypothetical protein